MVNDEIAGWRKRIDEIDKTLLKLLNERACCAIEIGKIKARHDLPVYDPTREQTILARLCDENKGPLDDQTVIELFQLLIAKTRDIEKQD